MWNLIAAALLASSSAGAQGASGKVCVEVHTWAALPAAVRSQLEAVSGVGAVAESGSPFNATDALEPGLPRSRFFGACHEGRAWVIALERGGRAYALELFAVHGPVVHSLARSPPAASFKTLLTQVPVGSGNER